MRRADVPRGGGAGVLLLALLLLAACGARPSPEEALCQVVLAQGEGFTASEYVQCTPRGGTVRFALREEQGYTVTGCDRPEAELVRELDGLTLRLDGVRFTERVHLSAVRSEQRLVYHANGGQRLDGGEADEPVEVPVTPSHLRLNTSTGQDLFTRPGHTLTGWNSAPDGSGTAVGLGSRVEPEEALVLYAQWRAWSPASDFRFAPAGQAVAVTAWLGEGEEVVVPAEADGKPVTSLAAGAFEGARCRAVVLPPTLRRIEDGAFRDAQISELTAFDSLRHVSDYAFSGCAQLRTLRLNAAEPPRYSGSYYATFPDKFDRLRSLRGQPKLVLFSGSSTRFGYDSALLEEAFPDYAVVNLGVFAYTNALPQFALILTELEAGDVLLHAPEFDAAQRQFCTTAKLDAAFFNLIEGDYDLLTRLDLRAFEQVFTALQAYLAAREGLPGRSYALSPADFDEEGHSVDTKSYNAYGDYILYRPNAPEDSPVYGLPVRYTPQAFPYDSFLAPLNAVYADFLARGVRVLFTYAPRNRLALSEDSTPEARAALDAWLREKLAVPVISGIEDSLFRGIYLSGTDNHLSTEGVALRTRRIIADLEAEFAREAAA